MLELDFKNRIPRNKISNGRAKTEFYVKNRKKTHCMDFSTKHVMRNSSLHI